MQKKTLLSIVFILSVLLLIISSPLLIPLILIYGLYIIKLVAFPFAVLYNFFEYVFISFFVSILVLIASFLFLKSTGKNIFKMIFLPILMASVVAIFGGLYEAGIYIENKSLDKFGIEPKYVSICLKSALQLCPFRCENICYYPHALVEKNGKYYYWSFKEKDFLILPESISCNIPYWRI